MRIVAGHYRGLKLETLPGLNTRPTKEMVREALFSSLGNICDKLLLDLFSGSGAIGIEAISRGARVIFNDSSEEACSIIKNNLAKIKNTSIVNRGDALTFLRQIKGEFDYIFCDPPYNYESIENIFKIIKEENILKNGGLIIYEESSGVPLKEKIGVYKLYKTKKYGLTRLNFYKEIV